MTIEEKEDTMRDFGTAISIAKRLLDDESRTFSVNVGAWTIEYSEKREATDAN